MRNRLLLLTVPILVCSMGFMLMNTVRPEVYFNKGNKIKFKLSSNDKEEVFYCNYTVKSVVEKNGVTTITVKDQRQYDTGKNQPWSYRLTYYCDAKQWCADALNPIDVDWKESSNPSELELISDSLVYPFNMQVGDSLPGASGREITKWESGSSERRVTYSKRFVAGQDDISIGSETLKAFRIECDFHYKKINIKTQEVTKTYIEWFVPSRGIVKRELKSREENPLIMSYILLPNGI